MTVILLLKARVRGHMRGASYVRPYVTRAPVAQPDLFTLTPARPVLTNPTPPADVARPAPPSPTGMYYAASRMVDGREVRFPDAAHAHLWDMGLALRRGEAPDPAMHAALWRHFQGMCEHDPATGAPFAAPEDVPLLAQDYVDPEFANEWLRDGEAASMVGAYRHEDYWRRGAELLRGTLLGKALAARADALAA